MKGIFWLCAAFLVMAAPAASAGELCEAVALRDVPAVESPTSVLKKGEIDTDITQYRVNKKTGESSFCSHGGYCFPAYLTSKGAKIAVLQLKNCKIGKQNTFTDEEAVIYDVDPIRSAFSSAQLKRYDVGNRLAELGLCTVCANNAAYAYVSAPNSRCGQLVQQALEGNAEALATMTDENFTCDNPAGGGIAAKDPPVSTHGASQTCMNADVDTSNAQVARVVGRTPHVNFIHDASTKAGCPNNSAACRAKAYVVPGDAVLLTHSQGDYRCASLVNAKGQPTTAWLPKAAVDPIAPRIPALDDWTGEWKALRNTLTIEATPAGELHIAGAAFWGTHDGEMDAVAKPVDDTMAFTEGENATLPFDKGEETDCHVRLRLRSPYLVAEDNGVCGGMNVTFSGMYVRHAPGQSAAERFVRDLYVPYATEAHAGHEPVMPKPEALYDAELLDLIDRDSAPRGDHETGYLEADPICACQDWTAIRVLDVSVQPKGTDRASATVAFADSGQPKRVLDYELVSAQGQWRIHDIHTHSHNIKSGGDSIDSLRQGLIKSLAEKGDGKGKALH